MSKIAKFVIAGLIGLLLFGPLGALVGLALVAFLVN